MAHLPWYAFLYRLLGAQGTFWLWIFAPLAMWWTGEAFWQQLENRTIAAATIEGAAAGVGRARWVTVTGVEVHLTRRLLLFRDEGKVSLLAPSLSLLLLPTSSAGQWWLEARQLADATLDGPAAGRAEAQMLLIKKLAALEGEDERDDGVPSPGRFLVVQEAEGAIAEAGPPDEALPFDERLLVRARRIREGVLPDKEFQGVLIETPGTLRERFRAELGVVASPFTLREGAKPRDLETYIFAGAAICMIFLAAGFVGASRSKVDEPAPEPAA